MPAWEPCSREHGNNRPTDPRSTNRTPSHLGVPCGVPRLCAQCRRRNIGCAVWGISPLERSQALLPSITHRKYRVKPSRGQRWQSGDWRVATTPPSHLKLRCPPLWYGAQMFNTERRSASKVEQHWAVASSHRRKSINVEPTARQQRSTTCPQGVALLVASPTHRWWEDPTLACPSLRWQPLWLFTQLATQYRREASPQPPP